MPDEQIIYLSPEEELTDVRERLEKVQAEHIILVVPPQTKLRSHVGWRLLHSRSRELGRDVLVISSDRQVRGVVKAAGFKVADSLESPPSVSKTRPPSRVSRAGGSSRGQGSRGGSKGAPSGRPRGEPSRNEPPASGGQSSGLAPSGPSAFMPAPSPSRNLAGRGRSSNEALEIEDLSGKGDQTILNRGAGQQPSFLDPTSRSRNSYGRDRDYDFEIDSAPSVPARLPEEDVEADAFLEDFRTAQRIRQATQEHQGEGPAQPGTLPTREKYTTSPIGSGQKAEPGVALDPFGRFEGVHPSPLPEQRGSFPPISDLDEDISDLTDRPTNLLADEVEDLGDQGASLWPSRKPGSSLPSWSAPGADDYDEEYEEDPGYPIAPPPAAPPTRGREDPLAARVQSARQRSGKLPTAPRPEQESIDERSEIDVLPTRVFPPGQQRPPARPAAGARPGSGPRTGSTGTLRPVAGSQRVANRASKTAARQRGGRVTAIVGLLLIIVLIALVALAYYGPSADVSLTLPARSYSQSLKLTASANSQLDAAGHTLPAEALVFDKSLSTQAQATGTTKVGVVKAHGTVEFTNNGQQPLVIPTGTLVTTAGGIQFVTKAEPLVAKGASYPVQVEAVNPGTTGNVAVHTITVIPPESLSKIGATATDLTVTNTSVTTGGGVGNASQVTTADVAAIKKTLDPKLQQEFQAWLTQSVHSGDIQGKSVQQEQTSAAPAAGQVAASGSFMGTLSIHATVLVVRAKTLQDAARAELNASAPTKLAGYVLDPQLPVEITKMQSTPSKNGETIALAFQAKGQVLPNISDADIQNALSGKSVNDATVALNSLIASRTSNATGDTHAAITVNPSFFPWLPLVHEHIRIQRSSVLAK